MENNKVKEKEKKKRQTARESIPMLTRKLDKIFSEYIRRRDANDKGIITCITCDTQIHWKESHNCHWIGRGCKLYRWDETNCYAGCAGCNTFNQERHQRVYTSKQIQKLGVEKVEEMLREEKNIHRVNKGILKELIEIYTNKLKELGNY